MRKFPITTRIKCAIYTPLLCFHVLAYKICKSSAVITSDIVRWGEIRSFVDTKHLCRSLIRLLVMEHTFRNQFYIRVGFASHFLNVVLPQEKSVQLTRCIGNGFCLVHAYSTIINAAAKIGNNCTVLHSVTIGAGKGGAPVIGDNVYIGAGAIIIGGVKIGNNVKIGAGAIIVNDVPDNATAVCEKARIIVKS